MPDNPFECGASFNATRALQLCKTDPELAKSYFHTAARHGRLDPHLAKVEADLFPPIAPDPYAWVDEISA